MFHQPEVLAQIAQDRSQQWQTEAAPRHLLRAAREQQSQERQRVPRVLDLLRALHLSALPR